MPEDEWVRVLPEHVFFALRYDGETFIHLNMGGVCHAVPSNAPLELIVKRFRLTPFNTNGQPKLSSKTPVAVGINLENIDTIGNCKYEGKFLVLKNNWMPVELEEGTAALAYVEFQRPRNPQNHYQFALFLPFDAGPIIRAREFMLSDETSVPGMRRIIRQFIGGNTPRHTMN